MSEKTELTQVTARFRCDVLEHHAWGGKQVKMSAVCDNHGANKAFTDATPSGKFEMMIAPYFPAGDFCKPGKVYEFIIREVEE